MKPEKEETPGPPGSEQSEVSKLAGKAVDKGIEAAGTAIGGEAGRQVAKVVAKNKGKTVAAALVSMSLPVFMLFMIMMVMSSMFGFEEDRSSPAIQVEAAAAPGKEAIYKAAAANWSIPWELLAGLGQTLTKQGTTSPYDTVVRDNNKVIPVVDPKIGGEARQGLGPYLLLPKAVTAATRSSYSKKVDPQSFHQSTDYVAYLISDYGKRYALENRISYNKVRSDTMDKEAYFWAAVLDTLPISGNTDGCIDIDPLLPVADLIRIYWKCELADGDVKVLLPPKPGRVATDMEARNQLTTEALTVAHMFSQTGVVPCDPSAQYAGVFPLPASFGARCDTVANIKEAARLVAGAAAVPLSGRPSSPPGAAAEYEWAGLPLVLDPAAGFRNVGFRGPSLFKQTVACKNLVESVLAADTFRNNTAFVAAPAIIGRGEAEDVTEVGATPGTTIVGSPPPSGGYTKKVLVAGDSLVGGFGPPLIKRLNTGTPVKVGGWYFSKPGSGLTRQDTNAGSHIYNWSTNLVSLIQRPPVAANANPDIVVLSLGTNDAQALTSPTGAIEAGWGSAGWSNAYLVRAEALIASARTGNPNRIVVWISPPPVNSPSQPGMNSSLLIVRTTIKKAVERARRRGEQVYYMDSNPILAPGGTFDPSLRKPDGVHMSGEGDSVYATGIAAAVQSAIANPVPQPAPVTTVLGPSTLPGASTVPTTVPPPTTEPETTADSLAASAEADAIPFETAWKASTVDRIAGSTQCAGATTDDVAWRALVVTVLGRLLSDEDAKVPKNNANLQGLQFFLQSKWGSAAGGITAKVGVTALVQRLSDPPIVIAAPNSTSTTPKASIGVQAVYQALIYGNYDASKFSAGAMTGTGEGQWSAASLVISPSDFTAEPLYPTNLVFLAECGNLNNKKFQVRPEVAAMWKPFCADATVEGITLTIDDAAKTKAQQTADLANPNKAGLVADPGTSIHEKGVALDVNLSDTRATHWIHDIVGCYVFSKLAFEKYASSVDYLKYAQAVEGNQATVSGQPVCPAGSVPVKRAQTYGFFLTSCKGSTTTNTWPDAAKKPDVIRCKASRATDPGGRREPWHLEPGKPVGPGAATFPIRFDAVTGAYDPAVAGPWQMPAGPGKPKLPWRTTRFKPGVWINTESLRAIIIGEWSASGVQHPRAIELALEIAKAESSTDPFAIQWKNNRNGSIDRGMFQMNSYWVGPHMTKIGIDPTNMELLYDPVISTKLAISMYKERWWRPWATASHIGVCKTLYCYGDKIPPKPW